MTRELTSLDLIKPYLILLRVFNHEHEEATGEDKKAIGDTMLLITKQLLDCYSNQEFEVLFK